MRVIDFIEPEADEITVAEPHHTRVHHAKHVNPQIAVKYNIPLVVDEMQLAARGKYLRPFALRMFVDHYPISKIAEALEISTGTISIWRQEYGWDAKRSELEQKFYNAVIQRRIQQVAECSNDAITVVSKVLRKYAKMPSDDLKLSDARAIAEILSNMDRVVRLSNGAPTEIHEKRNTTLKLPKTANEIREAIDADPFMVMKKPDET